MKFAFLFLCACGAAPPVEIPATLDRDVSPSDVKSYELWILNQVGRDNNPINCDDLLSRAITPASDNVLKVMNPIDGNFGASTITVKGIANGEQNRIFYIDLYDQPGEIGERVGAGCAASVTISGGKTTTVDITISAPQVPSAR